MPPPAPNGRRSPLAAAAYWSSQVTTIGLEMALPALGGYFLDEYLRTLPAFTVVGAVLGFIVAMMHLMDLAKRANRKSGPSHREPRT